MPLIPTNDPIAKIEKTIKNNEQINEFWKKVKKLKNEWEIFKKECFVLSYLAYDEEKFKDRILQIDAEFLSFILNIKYCLYELAVLLKNRK